MPVRPGIGTDRSQYSKFVGDVFGLSSVYERQVENQDQNNKFASWSESGIYGYYGGGVTPTTVSTIDRLDFSTETVTTPTPKLSAARTGLSAVSSSFYGYFGGGGPAPAPVSTIDRLDFSNDTVSVPTPKLSSGGRTFSAASSNSYYGYFGGGYALVSKAVTTISSIDRLEFSTETVSTPTPKLSVIRRGLSTISSSSYGYFGGGSNPTPPTTKVSTIDRLDFSTETISTPTPKLSQAKDQLAAVSNSSYGYFGGGSFDLLISTTTSTIERLDLSTETISVLTPKLSQARNYPTATSSSSYGYFGGGSFLPTFYSDIDRLDFSTETVTTPTPKLSQAKHQVSAISGGQSVLRGNKTYGYFGGGNSSPTTSVAIIERLDFSTETVTSPARNLSQAKTGLSATSSSSYGYFGGGFVPSVPSRVSTIERLDFSTEILTIPSPKLSTAKNGLAATSSSSYGYFGGGYFTPPTTFYSTIDRLDFSTETVSVPTPKLSTAKSRLTATSSSYYGYFGGGFFSPVNPPDIFYSTIDRLDFSTETVSTPTPKLSQAKRELTTTSSSSYGYFGGGSTPAVVSTIDRLDFSTETVTTPTPKLSQAKDNLAATSSSSYGYFGGGATGTPLSTIDRLDFSTETRSVPTPKLSQARFNLSATSNSN